MSVAYDRIVTEKVYFMGRRGIAEVHFVPSHRSLRDCVENKRARVAPFDARLSFSRAALAQAA
jgi:hypothetical protein